MPSQTYRQILASTPDDLNFRILSILTRHVGRNNRIPKAALIHCLYGRVTSTTDRQTRDAIADLQEAGYPILSDSSSGGYWLAASNLEAQPYLSEIDSRIARLSAKRRGILKGLIRTYGPPTLF